MDNFDKRIKQIAKDENWEIPNEIDNNISKLLKNIEEPKTLRKRPLKVAILVASLSILTITPAFAIENIIEYFNYNKSSEYISSKEQLETFGSVVSLTSKDNGIEFKLDNISVDDNYINIFYTIKGEKSIDEYYKEYSTGEKPKEAKYANPFIYLDVDKRKLKNLVMQEYEAVYISEYELKGMQRINVSNYNIKNKFNLKIYTNEIFRQEGDWTVSINIDKSKTVTETKKYNVNKNIEIKNKEYSVTEEKEFDVTHYLNIDKVIISPFGNGIVVKEKVDADFTKLDAISPIFLDSEFALVDENNNYLDMVGKGVIGHDSTTNGVTNSFEFKLKDKDIKSLRLVPIKYIGEENKILDIYDIDKLPITFEMNEYGKVIIEDIQINDSKIIYTYYTEGFVPYESGLVFFDENEKEIGFSCSSSENKNKKTGRITTTINLEGYGNDLNAISKIKKVSTYNNTKMRLLYDEAIEINLSN